MPLRAGLPSVNLLYLLRQSGPWQSGVVYFYTLGDFLLRALSGSQPEMHVTQAAGTGLYDLEAHTWNREVITTMGSERVLFPEVGEQAVQFIWNGKHITAYPALGDQQAALFGQCCLARGDVKNTYGTGGFLLMNTGDTCIGSTHGLLSTIGWGIGGKITYALEGSVFVSGAVIKWLRDEVKLIDSPRRCDELAESVPDANGCYLVPAFTGLGAPYWDMYARGCIVGLTRGVNRAHISRAVLESITYQMTDLLEAMKADSGIDITDLRVDGGASVSNIMMQIQADMAQTKVDRPKCVETTALGAAYLAGLAVGVWDSLDDIQQNREIDRIFEPQMPLDVRNKYYAGWKKAVTRAMNWEEKE